MVDIQQLDGGITWAVEHPDEFYIHSWFARTECGTTACLAGAIALLDGWTPHWPDSEDSARDRTLLVRKGGEYASVVDVAAGLLGLLRYLDEDLLDELFHAENLAAVIAVRNRLAVAYDVPERTWILP